MRLLIRRVTMFLMMAWKRFIKVDVETLRKDAVSSATLTFAKPTQLQMPMYGPPGGSFALPYPPGEGYHAARAIQATISEETDKKLREKAQKRRDNKAETSS